MGWRFWRRVRIAPGVTLNIGKTGPSSVSFGPRGFKVTAGRHGKRMTVGLPGTGLFYTEKLVDRPGQKHRPEPERPMSPPDTNVGPEVAPARGPRAFWGRRSLKGKAAIVTAAVVAVAMVANGGSTPGPGDSASGADAPSGPAATVQTRTATPTPSVSPSPSSYGEASATPATTPTLAPPTAKPVATAKPIPTPLNVTSDAPLAFVKSKRSLTGKAGSYTWSAVSFNDQLAKLTWTASASKSAPCTVKWRFAPDEYSYIDPFGATAKPSKGGATSGSKQVEVDEATGTLSVKSTCPRWSLAGTSTAPPLYWNPWGYNFTPGRVIYNPPLDFCGYFDCIGSFGNSAGYVIQCRDNTFSTAGGRQGACSYHGGVRRPLYRH